MYRGERFSGVSHLVGAVLALAGMVILIVMASRQGDFWKIVSFSVYGSTLFFLYLVSTLYHSLRGKAKIFFRSMDHSAIYLLIAGTYTPFTLVTLHGTWGWSLFGVIWVLAMTGLVLDAMLPKREPRIWPVVIYVLMGWLIVIALKPLLRALPPAGFRCLLAGGLFYTVGVIFFALDEKMRHAHGVWHLFVLAGSVSHYFAILFYVA